MCKIRVSQANSCQDDFLSAIVAPTSRPAALEIGDIRVSLRNNYSLIQIYATDNGANMHFIGSHGITSVDTVKQS